MGETTNLIRCVFFLPVYDGKDVYVCVPPSTFVHIRTYSHTHTSYNPIYFTGVHVCMYMEDGARVGTHHEYKSACIYKIIILLSCHAQDNTRMYIYIYYYI